MGSNLSLQNFNKVRVAWCIQSGKGEQKSKKSSRKLRQVGENLVAAAQMDEPSLAELT